VPEIRLDKIFIFIPINQIYRAIAKAKKKKKKKRLLYMYYSNILIKTVIYIVSKFKKKIIGNSTLYITIHLFVCLFTV
jgi:hypothetical protein